jgi:hypothetical protein
LVPTQGDGYERNIFEEYYKGELGPATQREESERDVRILAMLGDRVWGGLDVYNDTKKTPIIF